MTLDDVARQFNAYEAVDRAHFQRRARLLQSIWREEQGYPMGEHRGRPLGSRLAMPWAEETLVNYLTPSIREVVRQEVCSAQLGQDKLYGRPRIFNDLLSSQPLCFNLFGELSLDLISASSLIRSLTDGRFLRVLAVEFEYSPRRSDARYTGDRSAFDVFLRCRTARGGTGFVGIEVKYHESLDGGAGRHRTRYEEVATAMGCFRAECVHLLRDRPLQQIWRDHLLAGAVKAADGYDDALFVFLYPDGNECCREAIERYRGCLSDEKSFASWTIERVVDVLSDEVGGTWIDLFRDRYLAWAKIDRRLGVG